VTFATRYLVRTDPQQLVDALYDPSVNLATTVVFQQDPDITQGSAQGSDASAVITSYGTNTVAMTTSSSVDGFAVLSDTYYPGWVAMVDGKPAEVKRADYAIRAVAVRKGTHTVIVTYKPVSFIIGSVLTLIGIFLMIGVSYRIANKAK
jgi:uncharacterized membrane protein YfhO